MHDEDGTFAEGIDHETAESGELAEPGSDTLLGLRRVTRVLGAAAALAVALAVGANVIWSPVGSNASSASVEGSVASTRYVPQLNLEKPAVELLPSQIIAYETIARHAVPGQGDRAGEALYATYNMELDVQVPISVYARVDGHASASEAEAALVKMMSQYPIEQTRQLLGATAVRTGYRPDRSAWVIAWTKGQYMVLVKSAFRDRVPAEKRQFLKNLGLPAAQGIESYQRTGKQGLSL